MQTLDLTRTLRVLLAAGAIALLTACGGGGGDPEPEDDQLKTIPPLDCKARPELCE